MGKNRTDGIIVPPRSKENIEAHANLLREILGLKDRNYFPVMQAYEVISLIFPGGDFEVRTMREMGDDHGRTYPDSKRIYIREDVYEQAHEGRGRDRFTMCHELGHLMLHRGVALSRIDPRNPPKIYCNSEWQADTFASYLMMPRAAIAPYASVTNVARDFGTSLEAATARRGEMKNA